MKVAGETSEAIGKMAYAGRNEAKTAAREASGWLATKIAEARNLIKYGNRIGPSVEAVSKRDWEQVIESSTRSSDKIDRLLGVK